MSKRVLTARVMVVVLVGTSVYSAHGPERSSSGGEGSGVAADVLAAHPSPAV